MPEMVANTRVGYGSAFGVLMIPLSSIPQSNMSDQRLLSSQELDALFRRLDALIEEGRMLQQQISERLLASRRGDQPDRRGQPERRARRRKTE